MSAAKTISPFLSQKFRFWSFVSMVLLVFVHGYNLNDRYMQPFTIPGEAMTPTSFTEYFLANGIFRFRIPMLFIISGFLFALKDYVPHKKRLGGRVRTLLLPYLIWSAVGLLMILVLESLPSTKGWVASTHMMQISEKTLTLHDYKWWEVLLRWLFFPVCYQLWFLRLLFIYNVAYPAVRWCVTHRVARPIFFTVATLLWLTTFGTPLIEGEGLLFFSLGVWMQKRSFDIEAPGPWLNPKIWGLVFVSAAMMKTFLAFGGSMESFQQTAIIIAPLHKLTVASGLVAVWYGGDALVRWAMNRKWFVWMSAFSFIIYATHAPLVAMLIDPAFALLQYSEGYRAITFVLLPLALVAGGLATGALLRWVSPSFYSLLTGGRGLRHSNNTKPEQGTTPVLQASPALTANVVT